jgi:hypothetical protein
MISNTLATTYTKWADISVYLSMNDYQQGRYYDWIDERKKTRVLYMTNEAVKWAQPYLNGSQGFDYIANYMYALFGKWLLTASTIVDSGSAGLVIGTPVIPTATVGASGTITFVVGITGSPMAANSNQYTNTIFVNKNLIVILNNVVIQTIGTPVTYSLNTVTGTITFSNNLSLNQVVTIIYI